MKINYLLELLNSKIDKTNKNDIEKNDEFLTELLKNLNNLDKEELLKVSNLKKEDKFSKKNKQKDVNIDSKMIQNTENLLIIELNKEKHIKIDIKEIKTKIIKKSLHNPILKELINTKEFKEIKNLKDLFKVSKKYNLNLTKFIVENASNNHSKILDNYKIPTNTILNIKTSNKKHLLQTNLQATSINTKKSANIINEKHSFIKENNKYNSINIIHTKNQKKSQDILEILIKKIDKKDSTKEKEFLTTNKLENLDKSQNRENSEDKLIGISNTNFQFIHKTITAKESIKHFISSLQEKINDYKPPITKLTLELHPKELGKVEVTLKQKGDNLEIHINTNNQNAINFFSINQQELKNSLVNMGFTNINMNFNSNDQQKKHHQEKQNKNTIQTEEEELIIEFNYKYA